MNRKDWKTGLKRLWRKFRIYFLNPHFLICFGIGWMITNGWAYIGFLLGTVFGWTWLLAVSSAYLAFLWVPFTPEKLVSLMIALILLKFLYPADKNTLELLTSLREKIKLKHELKKFEKENRSDHDKGEAG